MEILTTLWLCIATITTSLGTIEYQDFNAYKTKEQCESVAKAAENYIIGVEKTRGREVLIKTFCLEIQSYKKEDKPEKEKKINETST